MKKGAVIFSAVLVLLLLVGVASAFSFSGLIKGMFGAGSAVSLSPTINNGLVAYYSFDNNYGDSSGNMLNGSLVGRANFLPMSNNYYLSLVNGIAGNSDGGYILVSPSPLLNLKNFTFSVWVNPSVGGGQWTDIVIERSGLNGAGIIARYNANGISFGGAVYNNYNGQNQNSYFAEPAVRSFGSWYHIVFTYDSVFGGKLYVNGANTYNLSVTGSNTLSSALVIGDAKYSNFAGGIDEVSVYNRALSSSEVQQVYDGQKGIFVGSSSSGGGGGGGSVGCKILSVDGISFYLSPCAINLTMVDGGGNVGFVTKIVGSGIYSYNVRGDGEGFPPYGYMGGTSGGSMGNESLSLYFNDGVLSADGSRPRVYRGQVPIEITGSSGWHEDYKLYLNVILTVFPAVNNTHQNQTATCTDSDGGLNYFVKGNVTNNQGGYNEDICGPLTSPSGQQNVLQERYCSSNGSLSTSLYDCPNGCSNGACVKNSSVPLQVCSELINSKGIISSVPVGYHLIYNQSKHDYFSPDGINVTGYQVEYAKDGSSNDDVVMFFMAVADDRSFKFENSKFIEEEIKKDLPWETINVNGNQIYSFVGGFGGAYIWVKGNVLMYLVSEKDISETFNADDFLKKLQDNQFKNVGNSGAEAILNNFITNYLSACDSEVSEACSPKWSQKVEPFICPEYGQQKLILTDDYSCDSKPVREETRKCSPGICSGCYVPRWMGFDNGDNVCIPYGTRLGQLQTAQTERLYEGFEAQGGGDYINLTILDETRAHLYLVGDTQVIFDSNVYEGSSYYIVEAGGKVQLRVDEIVPASNGNKGYIEFSMLENFDAFCNYNGNIGAQLSNNAQCQNNYECRSNTCSGGVCAGSTAGFQKFVVRILCSLAHPLDSTARQQCIDLAFE